MPYFVEYGIAFKSKLLFNEPLPQKVYPEGQRSVL